MDETRESGGRMVAALAATVAVLAIMAAMIGASGGVDRRLLSARVAAAPSNANAQG